MYDILGLNCFVLNILCNTYEEKNVYYRSSRQVDLLPILVQQIPE